MNAENPTFDVCGCTLEPGATLEIKGERTGHDIGAKYVYQGDRTRHYIRFSPQNRLANTGGIELSFPTLERWFLDGSVALADSNGNTDVEPRGAPSLPLEAREKAQRAKEALENARKRYHDNPTGAVSRVRTFFRKQRSDTDVTDLDPVVAALENDIPGVSVETPNVSEEEIEGRITDLDISEDVDYAATDSEIVSVDEETEEVAEQKVAPTVQ